jgi:curved DNA-binding protein CbpA
LKYHPDRNPGREQEVNAQFLTIQTAHDVLTDPQQKAKYDATRGRGGSSRFPTASGVRGNPWADAAQQFPTPPRRNQPPRNAASGADRWNTRFSAGVPPTARQQTAAANNSESRKNQAKAFENMRPKSQGKNTASAGNRNSTQAPPPTPPRTEGARQRQQAAFGSRKTGYQPRGSSSGDEPPVTRSSYAKPAPPPRPTAKASTAEARMPDPLSQFRDQSGEDGRNPSPYMSHSGEKTNPFDMGHGAAAAAKEAQDAANSQTNSGPAHGAQQSNAQYGRSTDTEKSRSSHTADCKAAHPTGISQR